MSTTSLLLRGNCLDEMKLLEDNSVDAIVTDPPYGLSFMGKAWDYEVPSVDIWREALRVLKPGGHLLSFFGTRTYHRGVVRIEDAGFEIRDQIMWIYGSGFPKSHNIKEGDFKGWGTALKPANEPIVVARKPLEKGLTIAQNVLKWGTGALNIDESRIGNCRPATINDPDKFKKWKPQQQRTANDSCNADENINQGRWPANILFDESGAEMLDEQSGILKLGGSQRGSTIKPSRGGYGGYAGNVESKPLRIEADTYGASRFFYVAKASKRERNAGLENNNLVWETDAWEKQDLNLLMENIKQLAKDTSEGISTDDFKWNIESFGSQLTAGSQAALIFTTSTALKLIIELKTSNAFQNSITKENIQDAIKTIEENGLSLAESAETISLLLPNITNEKTAYHLGVVLALLQMLYKIKGFAKQGNFHSTVKPIKLMEYLIKLVTPPNGTVLDPFMGSGSTGVAAKNLGFNFIGCEMNDEYIEIAKRRIGVKEAV